MQKQFHINTALSIEATLGEGPTWCPERRVLFWTDIDGRTFNRFDPLSGENRQVHLEDSLCAFCLVPDDLFLCAFTKEIALMDGDGGGKETLLQVEADKPDNRFNDGKCDPAGRFWVGTMSSAGKPGQGSLYRFDPDGSLHHMLDGLGTSNGLGWSPDGKTFYLTDSPAGEIYAFDFDMEAGAIARQRVFASIPVEQGRPDGLTIDTEGGVWSAHWDGWRITRYLPSGEIDEVIQTPVPKPTSVMFGGDDLDTLFFTSARKRLDPDVLVSAPLSGSLFTVKVGYSGSAEPVFSLKR